MRKIALFLIVLLTIVSCKKDEPVSPDFSDIFVGTWTATTLKGSGNTISLVGIKDPALYMVITRVANNKLNATLSSYSNGQTTKSGTLNSILLRMAIHILSQTPHNHQAIVVFILSIRC
ncbi:MULTISPECIES: hypothetical protein [unclassified Arcicella]|uniref:hypothetical protein n=1 Tax=unclassified Arcicella TaxID=2644986 RepID=UPI00285E14DE|nr:MULTISPECIES: hypothetical protein [unclassified Arcicella]MDR6564384.1 hypothetical protein [Arcicella sp. BE51]MDR6814133.1 hypothetical protein [Arcicella sp. BE140]MDR6825445.1 hypothetical protein [Arcicella sp. BE139]